MQNAPLNSNFYNRRFFFQKTLFKIMAFTSVGYFLTNCSDGDDDDPAYAQPDTGNCLTNGTEVNIQLTHTPNHILIVSKDDVVAGVEKTYTLENNGSGHTHEITLTSDHFQTLRTNTSVQFVSTFDSGHTHVVTVNCA